MSVRSYVDGHWIDIGSLITGFSYAAYLWRAIPHQFLSAATGIDVAKGSALFPLIVLSGAVLSSQLRNELIKANPLTLSLAGVVALFATLSA